MAVTAAISFPLAHRRTGLPAQRVLFRASPWRHISRAEVSGLGRMRLIVRDHVVLTGTPCYRGKSVAGTARLGELTGAGLAGGRLMPARFAAPDLREAPRESAHVVKG